MLIFDAVLIRTVASGSHLLSMGNLSLCVKRLAYVSLASDRAWSVVVDSLVVVDRAIGVLMLVLLLVLAILVSYSS